MSCNCKKSGKSAVLNNLNSPTHIEFAREIYQRVVTPNENGEYSDLDKIEIVSAFSTLYPNASTIPSIEHCIEQIKIAIEVFDSLNTKKFKR